MSQAYHSPRVRDIVPVLGKEVSMLASQDLQFPVMHDEEAGAQSFAEIDLRS